MATTTLTLTVDHGEASGRTVPDAMPDILRELADQLDHEDGTDGLALQVPRDRGRLRLRSGRRPLGDVTGVRAAWTAVTK